MDRPSEARWVYIHLSSTSIWQQMFKQNKKLDGFCEVLETEGEFNQPKSCQLQISVSLARDVSKAENGVVR